MTGLKTKCQAGRPNWESVLGQIHKSSTFKVNDCILQFEQNHISMF